MTESEAAVLDHYRSFHDPVQRIVASGVIDVEGCLRCVRYDHCSVRQQMGDGEGDVEHIPRLDHGNLQVSIYIPGVPHFLRVQHSALWRRIVSIVYPVRVGIGIVRVCPYCSFVFVG